MRAHLAAGGLILAATHGSIGIGSTQELWLGQITSATAQTHPSPLVGEGWEGGSGGDATASTAAIHLATPTPSPSPQGGGEREKP
jgi:hypothetical protein